MKGKFSPVAISLDCELVSCVHKRYITIFSRRDLLIFVHLCAVHEVTE